jgi:hypothetical protein
MMEGYLIAVESVTVDIKEKNITVIREAAPFYFKIKLKKSRFTELLSVGPAKEEKKTEKKEATESPKAGHVARPSSEYGSEFYKAYSSYTVSLITIPALSLLLDGKEPQAMKN